MLGYPHFFRRNREGYTPTHYSQNNWQQLSESHYVSRAQWIRLKHINDMNIPYTNKRKMDFWKKIQEVTHIATTFDYTTFNDNQNDADVEFELREVIRKRKEIHSLKEVGFIWMAKIPPEHNLMHIFMHYFKASFCCITHNNEQYYLGWSETLSAISMRHFVCEVPSK